MLSPGGYKYVSTPTPELLEQGLKHVNELRVKHGYKPVEDFKPAAVGMDYTQCLIGRVLGGNLTSELCTGGINAKDPLLKEVERRFEQGRLPCTYYVISREQRKDEYGQLDNHCIPA